MVGELPDELLADHPGRAEDPHVDSLGLHDLHLSLKAQLHKKKPAGLFPGRRVLLILL